METISHKQGGTIVAALSVKFECDSDDDKEICYFDSRNDSIEPKITRISLLQALHLCMGDWLKGLSDSALEGVLAKSFDR